MASGNTIGAGLWTDGQMDAPMMPKQPAITECEGCGKFYWLYRAREVGEYYYWFELEGRVDPGADPAWKNAPNIGQLSEAQYYQMVKERVWTTRNKEKQLRVFAWWRGNDRYRDTADDFIEKKEPTCKENSPERRQNMKRLFVLLEEEDPNQCMMKAEVARQLGNFDDALELLSRVRIDEYRRTADKMIELSKAGSRDLVELEME